MTKTVEEYMQKHSEWSHILDPLRALLLDSELSETVKWGAPVYTLSDRNVVGLGAFKSYAGLWFFDGSLLTDADQVLVNAQQGRTRGMRQWRFQAEDDVNVTQVRSYITQAMANAKTGKHIVRKAKGAKKIPRILADALDQNKHLATAFDEFTAGKQREFSEYITMAKKVVTRENRLAKITPMILRGEGLNDRYRKQK